MHMTRFARFLLVPAILAAVLLPAGAASARPVLDQPLYCSPGTHYLSGHGCVPDKVKGRLVG